MQTNKHVLMLLVRDSPAGSGAAQDVQAGQAGLQLQALQANSSSNSSSGSRNGSWGSSKGRDGNDDGHSHS
jgi:hypothetical protein